MFKFNQCSAILRYEFFQYHLDGTACLSGNPEKLPGNIPE